MSVMFCSRIVFRQQVENRGTVSGVGRNICEGRVSKGVQMRGNKRSNPRVLGARGADLPPSPREEFG